MQNNIKNPSVLKLACVCAGVFVISMVFLNGPLIISVFKYPFTHSEQSDNEKLTAEYIKLYGYETQQKKLLTGTSLSNIAQAATPSVLTKTLPISVTTNNHISIS